MSTCAAAGFPGTLQLTGTGSASDSRVTGTVSANTGPIDPGHGQVLNATIAASSTVVAVIVKGADGYNVYSRADVLPPALGAPQNYVSPFNDGGHIPDISHWLVCYTFTPPTPPDDDGTLTLSKALILPPGFPAESLPAAYTATVTCSDGTTTSVTFGQGGGAAVTNSTITKPGGTTCTVVEDTAGLSPQPVVTYNPPGANTPPGVTIESRADTLVTITNDFSGVPEEHGEVRLEKVVVNTHGVPVPDHFTAGVLCDDSVTDVHVTLPATGGLGTPVVTPLVGFDCHVEELDVPAGWTVEYSVDGGPPTTGQASFNVMSTAPITVTITNTAPSVTPSPSPTAPIPSGAPETGIAPASGGPPGALLLTGGIALGLAGLAAGVVAAARRRGSLAALLGSMAGGREGRHSARGH